MVDAFVRYPANSVVDLNVVTSKLVANRTGGVREKDPRSETQMVREKHPFSRSKLKQLFEF